MATVQDDGEYNLQEAWDKACTSFAQTAKIDLTTAPKFSVDEVLDQIRVKQDDDDEKNNKYIAAKDAIGKTLKFVTLLGGIAAQGASMVFAPAGLCFNAISYLIDTGAKFKRIFSSLAELFRRISDVLERCKIYMRLPADAVDVALRKIINEELVCFVDICALSIKVLKGHKVFIALKVFAFDGDEGVSGQLARLTTLVERESQMRATLGFESQKMSERNIIENRDGTRKINVTVDKLLRLEKKREADTSSKKLLESIDSSLYNPSEAFKVVQRTFRRLLSDRVQGSGEWLKSDPLYAEWASHENSPFSVFGISGGEGYGKSFLFASIVKYLQDEQPQSENDMRCISTAYHIFDHDNKQTSLVQALKVLAWQIADQDIVYRKDISSVKATGINQIGNLWDILFSKSYKSDSTFFLLLDGIDQIEKSELKEFVQVLEELHATSESWADFRLRIFITGRNDTISKVKSQLGGGMLAIDAASENNDDVEKFIIDRMKKMEILSGSSDQVRSLQLEILENLKAHTHGDFVNIGLLLHEISGKQRPGEIRDILSRSGGKRSDTIARKIERLNETLNEEDISDLNTILTWVIYAWWPPTLATLEGVLFLKAGESSLRPLAEKITDEYSSLVRIMGEPHPTTKVIPADSHVELVSDSIMEFILNNDESDNLEDAPDLDRTGNISEVEVRIVRRFLESVCDPKLFSKFGFEEFFQRKLKGKTALVGVDFYSINPSMLSTCLEVINHQESPTLASLLSYTSSCFHRHLERADPSLMQPQQKIALGPQLVNLFADEDTIRKWWRPFDSVIRCYWIYEDEFPEIALKWLQDSAVTRNLPDDQYKWVKSLSSKSEPDADIMEHIAKFTARLWLKSGLSSDQIAGCFAAVHGYITKIENRKNPQIQRSIEDPEPDNIDASQILDAAEWARQKLGLDSLGYYETRNLACTLREYMKYTESIEYLKLSCSLREYNWLAQWGLATSYACQGEFALAVEAIETAKNVITCSEIRDDDHELIGMDRDLAKYNEMLGDNHKSFAIYEEMLRNDPDDYFAALEMTIHFHKDKNYEGLLEFLDSRKASIDDSTGLNRRTLMFHELYSHSGYHEAILALSSDSKAFNFIFESYQEAIIAAKQQRAKATSKGDIDGEILHHSCQAFLMDKFAYLCYNNSSDNVERREFAIEQWVDILLIDETPEERALSYTKDLVRKRLANVFFHEALRDADTAATYLEQLEQLATLKSTYDTEHPKTYVAELFARYYTLQGDGKKAKDAVRVHIKRNIDILSDDDPLNDWQGHRGLAKYLMFAGQDVDCLVAWSLVVSGVDPDDPNSSDAETTSQLSSVGVESVSLDSMGFEEHCYGCGVRQRPENFYICRECDDTAFDESCYTKLREGTLEVNICGKDHDMLHVPPFDPVQRQRVGRGNVLVGEEIIPVTEWLQQLKEKWDIHS
ncbi:Tetratricopeptide-like helical [Penicillium cf. griseofulvum]|uniref:Tetratricopeptide-like helical n=1 Tax=Penicillium cf. griseofulvum TaxID=2972120 RepID=A0A9W9T6K2_9EURO|nr:Tetratricopeptide-like helical [Penicillium cf. griseofulvum]KAJ5422566.1 Tetratricopeptide-like helical [Penicillium cf. griseofulvum]